jgi:hypothetical protein
MDFLLLGLSLAPPVGLRPDLLAFIGFFKPSPAPVAA